MREDSGKKKSYRGYWTAAIVIVVISAFAIRFSAVSRTKNVESISSIYQKEGRPVEAVTVSRGDLVVWQTLAGTVEGIIQYPIVSTNSIQVMDILKREGDWVNDGDIIIRLEKTATNPMLHSYERARALYENALQDTRRIRNLFKEGAVSQQALESSEMALKIAESDLRDAREGTDLTADHAGVVMNVLVEKGEMAENGKPLAWIARTDTVKVVFKAGSRQAMALSKGQEAKWIYSGTGWSGEGTIDRVDLAADPETHLVGGEAVFPNPEGRLIPGILLSFKVLTGDRKDVLLIPAGCVMSDDEGKFVFALSPDSENKTRAAIRRIVTGLSTSDHTEVVSGLSEGDSVVVFGQNMIGNGDLVKVISLEEED